LRDITSSRISQRAVTFHRVAAFCFAPAFADKGGCRALVAKHPSPTPSPTETPTPTPTPTDCRVDQSRAGGFDDRCELAVEVHDEEIVEGLHKVS
jgi:hypothetical protein